MAVLCLKRWVFIGEHENKEVAQPQEFSALLAQVILHKSFWIRNQPCTAIMWVSSVKISHKDWWPAAQRWFPRKPEQLLTWVLAQGQGNPLTQALWEVVSLATQSPLCQRSTSHACVFSYEALQPTKLWSCLGYHFFPVLGMLLIGHVSYQNV